MIYAEVIVRKKTRAQTLTYSVPVGIIPYIKPGSLVTVPLRGKVETAIVTHLLRRLPIELRDKVRAMADINKKQPPFTEQQIKVIEQLANHYAAPLAQVAVFGLTWPASELSKAQPSRQTPVFIQASYRKRWAMYRQILEKYLIKKRVLLLFAQHVMADAFWQQLSEKQRLKTVILDGSAKQRRLIGSSEITGFIGTLAEAFWPLVAGDIVIVDQPYHVGARHRQAPHLSLPTISQTRATIEGLSLILGSDVINLADYQLVVRRQWRLISHLPAHQLTIISRRQSRTILQPGLLEQLQESVAQAKKVLIMVLSKGWAPAIICQNCQTIIQCPNCHHTLAVLNQRQLGCRYCGQTLPWPKTCIECQSNKLRPIGEGIKQVVNYLKEELPTVKSQEVSSDSPNFDPNVLVTVATEKIFSFPGLKFDQVIVVTADRLLSGSEVDGPWDLVQLIYQLLSLAASISIQTYFPDHPVWSIIATGKLRQWLSAELDSRRRWQLPPFATHFLIHARGRQTVLDKDLELIATSVTGLLPAAAFQEPIAQSLPSQEGEIWLPVVLPGPFSHRLRQQLASQLPPAWHLDFFD